MEQIKLIFSFKGVQEDNVLLHSFKAGGCFLIIALDNIR